jgi:hypothetical protein
MHDPLQEEIKVSVFGHLLRDQVQPAAQVVEWVYAMLPASLDNSVGALQQRS